MSTSGAAAGAQGCKPGAASRVLFAESLGWSSREHKAQVDLFLSKSLLHVLLTWSSCSWSLCLKFGVLLNHWAVNTNPFFQGWKPGGKDSNSVAAELLEAKLSSGSLLWGQAWSQETEGSFPLLRKCFLLFFFKTYLITKLVSKLKCFLQVNKDILRYAFRSWECFILRRAGAWILKNGPKNALNSNYRHSSIVIPTPLPNKLLPFTLKGAQGPRKVWYPKQSLDVGSCLLSRWEARNNKLKGLCGCVQPPWITQPIFCSLSRKLHLLFPHCQGFSSIYPAECDILRGRTGIPQTRSSFAEKGTSIIHQITPNIIPIHCPCRFLFKAPAVSAFRLGDKHKRLIPVRSGIVCVKQGNPALKRLLPQHVQNNNNKYYD